SFLVATPTFAEKLNEDLEQIHKQAEEIDFKNHGQRVSYYAVHYKGDNKGLVISKIAQQNGDQPVDNGDDQDGDDDENADDPIDEDEEVEEDPADENGDEQAGDDEQEEEETPPADENGDEQAGDDEQEEEDTPPADEN